MISIVKLVFAFPIVVNHINKLAEAVFALAPNEVTKEEAWQEAFWASMEETPAFPAELLLSMMYVESHHDPMATSRMEGGKRITGRPAWKSKPDNVTGPYFCGLTQAEAGMSWNKCIVLRDAHVAAATTVKELTTWRNYGHGSLDKALGGYGCGKLGALHPETCGIHKEGDYSYPARVEYRARLLRKALTPTS